MKIKKMETLNVSMGSWMLYDFIQVCYISMICGGRRHIFKGSEITVNVAGLQKYYCIFFFLDLEAFIKTNRPNTSSQGFALKWHYSMLCYVLILFSSVCCFLIDTFVCIREEHLWNPRTFTGMSLKAHYCNKDLISQRVINYIDIALGVTIAHR